MTDAVECCREATGRPQADAESAVQSDAETDPDPERVAAEIERRAERVRQQELDTALRKLDAHGELTPDQRRVVAALSASLADALVERWAAALEGGDAAVDPDAARDLLTE